MGRFYKLICAAAVLFTSTGVESSAQTQTQMFVAPSVRGVLLDYCKHFGRDCGQAAADLFCREVRFDRATSFSVDESAGARGIPTLVFGDGALCQGPQCSGFRQITCAKTAVAQPQPAAPPAAIAPLPLPPALPPPPPVVVRPPAVQPPPVIVQPLPVVPPPPVVARPVPTVPGAGPVPLPRLRPRPSEVAVLEPPKPRIEALSPEIVAGLPLGEIHLVDPRVEPDYLGDIANERAGQIPVWDDETVFRWWPSNPGMADSFDLRFFASRESTEPLGSVRVDGSRTYRRPDIAFMAGLLESAGVRAGPQDDIWALLSLIVGAKQGNLFWEVAGLRGYSASGVAEGKGGQENAATFDAEIAVSERWPLRTTDRPNGYGACGPGDGQAPELNKANLEFKNMDALAAARPLGVDYVYDRMRLEGQFSLANSPYASHPKNIMGPPPPGDLINLSVASYRFDNLFIDWGDGVVDPLAPDALDHGQYGRNSLLGLPKSPPLEHRYDRAGTFTIRIFQVSEQDLQKVHVASLNVAFELDAGKKAPVLAGQQQPTQAIGYYGALVNEQGAGSATGVAIDPSDIQILQGGFPLEVANRAYVVYCKPVKVTEPKDEAAFGPLVLYSVDVEFDESHAIDKANPVAASVAACDRSAKARARLRFAGKGRATVVWKIDGVMVGGATEHDIGPSPPRSAAELVNGAPPKQGTWLSDWAPLAVSEAMIGGHQITVEIKVRESEQRVMRLLRPSRETQAGAPPVITVPIKFFLIAAPDGTIPRKEVTSPPRTYTVVENAPGKPCHLRFMVAGGAFDVYLPDPDAVTASGDTVAGSGNLLVHFANQGSELSIPIAFDGWQVANETNVVAGTLKVDGIADGQVNLPGLSVALAALAGTAGVSDGEVQATIDVKAEGGALRSAAGSPKPPTWTGEQARLAPDGDWYRLQAKKGISPSLIGWSGFLIDAGKVTLDFSAGEGAGPGNACGDAGTGWIGVRLDDAEVEPNLFHLDTIRVPAAGWVIGDSPAGSGLCGDLDVDQPVPKRPVGEGHIAISHLGATVRGGFLKNAAYAMEVGVPILGLTLAGTGKLMETAGQAPTWNLSGLTGPPADLDLGTVRLQASEYLFGTDAVGWRVRANAKLLLTAESKPLATVNVNGVGFGLDGRIRFDDAGTLVRTLALGGKSSLGQSPVDLLSATLTGPASGATRLDVQVATKIRLSDALPAPDVDVTYQIAKSGNAVSASGPATTPFEIKVAFPAGDPGMSAIIKPQYVGGQGAASGIRFYAGPGNAVVDLLGGSGPIQSAFVLGYVGGSDYWMTLTDYELGPTGTPLVPPILNLFRVNGGLGYHVRTDKFVGLGDVRDVTADLGAGLTFLAGITAGTGDHVTFTIDGQLKMTDVDKVRLDFTSWLLKQRSGSTGDFTGFIQYGGGSFDGQLWGGLSMLGGAVKVSADQGAVDLHFGSGGPWHIYLGRREGPKIEVTLLDLGGTNGYLMLSGEGFFVGSGANINLGGSVGPFSAHIKGWLNVELGIEPLKPRVSGSGTGGLSVKGCAFGLCVGPSASVTVKMAALPVDVSARACFEVDLLLKTVGACANVSL